MAKNYSTSVQLLVMILLVLMLFVCGILGKPNGPSTCVNNRKLSLHTAAFFLNYINTRFFLN
jgi:hypothetical protein